MGPCWHVERGLCGGIRQGSRGLAAGMRVQLMSARPVGSHAHSRRGQPQRLSSPAQHGPRIPQPSQPGKDPCTAGSLQSNCRTRRRIPLALHCVSHSDSRLHGHAQVPSRIAASVHSYRQQSLESWYIYIHAFFQPPFSIFPLCRLAREHERS